MTDYLNYLSKKFAMILLLFLYLTKVYRLRGEIEPPIPRTRAIILYYWLDIKYEYHTPSIS